MDAPSQKYPLQPIVEKWRLALTAAEKDRKEKFDKWADEAMNFFDGPTNWMWDSVRGAVGTSAANKADGGHRGFLAAGAHLPDFEMSVNRLFEAVSMFGPVLYHQNPTIAVTSRNRPEVSIEAFYAGNDQARQIIAMIPAINQGIITDENIINLAQSLQMQYQQITQADETAEIVDETHSEILECLSNYMQQEGAKQDEARLAITEAIITGLGLFEIVVEQPVGGGLKIPHSRYRTNKDLLVDPDAKYWRDVTWIALRNVKPVNVVEAQFTMPPGSLKGKYARQSALEGKNRNRRNGDGQKAGVTHDLIEYWTIYSKNGAGQNLKTGEQEKVKVNGLEFLGDFVKLEICDKCPYPLNLHPGVLQQQDPELILEQASWEVPYWDDQFSDGGWPVVRLSFYNKPGCVWPISMVKPCIGELRFINWCMSFIADKVSSGSQIYVGVLKSAAENIRAQLTSGRGPFTVIELEQITGKKLDELISFLQAPSFSIDIWNMIAEVNEQIDKRLGLTELVYGMSSRQMRSAAEAQYRQQNINVRPDDMASRVEDWLSLAATREIQALRYKCDYEDVMPIIGPTAAQVYAEQILTDDVSRLTRDFKFRVEAGTARKPNKDTKIAQLTDVGQYILPVIQQAMLSGVTRPYNAYMQALGKAMDMDVDDFLVSQQEQEMLIAMNAPPEPKPQKETKDE